MMNCRTLLAVAILVASACVIALPATEAEGGFEVTDGTGKTFSYNGAAERFVISGAAATLTVAQAGAVGKIVAVDKYSTYSYTGYDDLKNLHAEDLGSFYGTTNHDYIVATLVKMAEDGRFSKDDTVILTSYTSNLELREKLETNGFSKVLVWNTIDEYGELVKMVEDVSRMACGGVPASVEKMKTKIADVEQKVKEKGGSEKPKALYVWYYNKEFQVGNNGIMKSMLDVCGADNIGYDPSNPAYRYGDAATIVKLLENAKDAVVFVSNSYFSNGKSLDSFYDEVFNGDKSVKAVAMGLQWNNWCPESADGLMAIADALYPADPAPAPEPEKDEGSGGIDVRIIGVAIVGIVMILAGVALLFKKRRGRSDGFQEEGRGCTGHVVRGRRAPLRILAS